MAKFAFVTRQLAIALLITFLAFQAALLWLVLENGKDRAPAPLEQRERAEYAL